MDQLSSSGLASPEGNAHLNSRLTAEGTFLPLVVACSFGPDDSGWWGDATPTPEDCRYHNAATCPDCGTGMVRLGNCYSCPGCGWGSCGG